MIDCCTLEQSKATHSREKFRQEGDTDTQGGMKEENEQDLFPRAEETRIKEVNRTDRTLRVYSSKTRRLAC